MILQSQHVSETTISQRLNQHHIGIQFVAALAQRGRASDC